jgi:hypothetical protein
MTAEPIRLPDTATIEAVLAGLDPTSADADLAPTLSAELPGFFSFATARVDDFCWRGDTVP